MKARYVAIVFAIGCSGSKSAAPAPVASDAVPAPVASDAAPAGELPRAAAQECAGALQAIARGEPYGVLAGCADLFPSCAASWRAMAGAGIAVLEPLRACRDAYCPSLAAPKPAVCDGRPVEAAGDGSELTSLLAATLVHDHHIEAADAHRLANTLVTLLTPGRPIQLPPAPRPP